jgi:Protein of unknown function (DUF1353)
MKTAILTPLDLEKRGSWHYVTKPFRFASARAYYVYEVPPGFPTDLASARVGNWQLMGTTEEPAVAHDYLYATGQAGKLGADLIFYDLLRAAKTPRWKAVPYVAVVMIAAWPAWRAHRRGKTLASRFLRGLELVPLPTNRP